MASSRCPKPRSPSCGGRPRPEDTLPDPGAFPVPTHEPVLAPGACVDRTRTIRRSGGRALAVNVTPDCPTSG
jgi:hypothetical protein